MTDENARASAGEVWRWLVLTALLLACLAGYFLYAPRVPPVIHPAKSAETQ
jgi:hypothetical protein